jgi:uncharacterized protein (DUF1501 family)
MAVLSEHWGIEHDVLQRQVFPGVGRAQTISQLIV